MADKTTFGKTYELSKEEKLKKIGSQIRKRRKELKMTQSELAELCGCKLRSLGNLERGLVDLSVSRLYELAELLDVNLSYLLSLQELPSAGGEVVIDYGNSLGGEATDIHKLRDNFMEAVEKAGERETQLTDRDLARIRMKGMALRRK